MAVVGAGFTGLAAAWELARHHRHVVVVDSHDVGRGASARNGGMVHPGGKHDLATMLAMPRGRAMWDDTVAAFEGVETLVTELGIVCDWRRSGHLETFPVRERRAQDHDVEGRVADFLHCFARVRRDHETPTTLDL